MKTTSLYVASPTSGWNAVGMVIENVVEPDDDRIARSLDSIVCVAPVSSSTTSRTTTRGVATDEKNSMGTVKSTMVERTEGGISVTRTISGGAVGGGTVGGRGTTPIPAATV
jgi:hypothetical protein